MLFLDDLQAAAAYRQRAACLREEALDVSRRKKMRMLKEAADWEWRAACIEGTLTVLSTHAIAQLPLVA
jgi:hypothetical protein